MKILLFVLVLLSNISLAQRMQQFHIVHVEHNGKPIKYGDKARMAIAGDSILYIAFVWGSVKAPLTKIQNKYPKIYAIQKDSVVVGNLFIFTLGVVIEIFRLDDEWIIFNDRYTITLKEEIYAAVKDN